MTAPVTSTNCTKTVTTTAHSPPRDGINHYGQSHHQHAESWRNLHPSRSEDANGNDLQGLIGNPWGNARP